MPGLLGIFHPTRGRLCELSVSRCGVCRVLLIIGTGLLTSFFDVFMQIDTANPVTIQTFASDTSASPPGCPTCPPISIAALIVEYATAPVPEPGMLMLLLSGGI